ncbi:Phthiocerol/phthiodiolone dimycocerosyl transferase [Nocardia otitidiscaviarum]|uniref:Phthiocerol/phthiodiolone dimycocerosyl transferase n=1 Tax=Nocardia otitidiscaviarum TaxID=1823 RepID=A0A379JJ35_9NOCA|nr:hypothetical protein [Nocardia otitidiscaviarum]SUD48424.1 Phthiocerol/phthiodiolone dimycocerosyl transferase [Nocardia otitidiscaviarum]
MTTPRPLTPFELAHFDREAQLGSVPKAEVALYIGTTVRGEIDVEILRRVLAELAAGHAVLRAVVVRAADGGLGFVLREDYQPPLEIRAGGDDEYQSLINSKHDWGEGLFKGYLLRDGELSRIVLAAHHGVCDGRSMFPLVHEMWERYSAHLAGQPLPLSDVDRELPDGVDAQLARTVSDAELDAFMTQLAAIAAATDPATSAPVHLPIDGDGIGDPRGRFTLRSLDLSADDSEAIVTTARAHGVSVNSLLAGAALTALRTELDVDSGPAMMLATHCVDVRDQLSPPLSGSTILNCVSGVPTPVFASADADPIELARIVEVGVRGGVEARFPALILRALSRGIDPEAAGMPTIVPSLGLSNIGRMPAYPIPPNLELVRNFVYGMGEQMPPTMTMFTLGDRLTVQVDYDTVEHSHAQMGRVTEAMRQQLRHLCDLAPTKAG